MFDVFLAYNSSDKETVFPIYKFLSEKKINCWIDLEEIKAGDNVQQKVANGIQESRNAIIFVGGDGIGRFQGKLEVPTLINLLSNESLRVIPVLLPGVRDIPKELTLIKHLKAVSITGVDNTTELEEIVAGIETSKTAMKASSKINVQQPGLQSLRSLTGNVLEENFDAQDDVDWTSLLDQIKTGRAILYAGRNFSRGSKNKLGVDIPSHKELANQICGLANLEDDDDLDYAAEYFLANFDKHELLTHLIDQLSVSHVNDMVAEATKPKWLRIYTINYDDSLEYASRETRESPLKSTSAWNVPQAENSSEYECVHINGMIQGIQENDIQEKFLLSGSSFTTASFTDSYWYSTFKKDLEKCNIIFFLGCTFDDFKPIKSLFENRQFKSKAFFVIENDVPKKEKFLFRKYGKLIEADSDQVIQIFHEADTVASGEHEFYIESFISYELKTVDVTMTDNDIWNFLTYGELQQEYFEQFVSAPQRKPYMITRKSADDIIDDLVRGNTVVVHSEFGNGKTVLLEQIKATLALQGKEIFTLYDAEADYQSDVDKIVDQYKEQDFLFIVDGYAVQENIAHFLFQKNRNRLSQYF